MLGFREKSKGSPWPSCLRGLLDSLHHGLPRLDFHPVLLLIASQVGLARGPEPLCLRYFSLYGPEDGVGGRGQREEGRDFGSGWGEHWQFKGRAGRRWATSHQWGPACSFLRRNPQFLFQENGTLFIFWFQCLCKV